MKRAIFAVGLLFIVYAVVWAVYNHRRSARDVDHLTLYGNVDVRQVDIGFRVPGLVNKLHYEEGDWVSRGDLLASLETTPYDSQLKAARAREDATRALFTNAEILFNRRRELIGSGGVSQEDLDNAEARYHELSALLLQAIAEVQVARDNLLYTKAYAPTEGTILTRIREPGTVVNPADPVFTISVSSPVWIRAFVDEPHLGAIYYGMEAEIVTDTASLPTYKGYVGFISPVAEFTPKTVQTESLRTDLVYRLRIYAENPDHYLKQGMPVTVKLKTKRGSE